MYKKILMPTDGSAASANAIREGLEVAKSMGAEVTFLYAIENLNSALWISPESVPYGIELMEDLKKVGNEALNRAIEVAKTAGVPAQSKLVELRPVDAILQTAKDFDMVVMGTHGRSGLDRFMLGSVTEAVLHRCEKPVLVLRSK